MGSDSAQLGTGDTIVISAHAPRMMKNRGIFISVSSLVGVERRKRDVHWVPRPSMRPSASMRLVRLCRLRMSNRQDGSLDGAIRARRGANEFTAGFVAVKSLST